MRKPDEVTVEFCYNFFYMKRKINKAKRVSHSCRNHGSCPYCRRSRLHNATKRKLEAKMQIREWKR